MLELSNTILTGILVIAMSLPFATVLAIIVASEIGDRTYRKNSKAK